MAIKRGLVSAAQILTTFMWLSAFAAAQGTGGATITGVAKDSSGAVLPGVTVEASSPVLTERVRSTVTDSEGRYRIVELRPGTYVVTYTLSGFSTFRREGLELPPNFTATVDVQLTVGAVSETITVTGETPLIDTKAVTRVTVINRNMLDALPTSKSVGGLIALVPAAVNPVNGLDTGGSKGEMSVRISVHGARTGDMRQMTSGMLYSNLNSNGAGRLYFVNPTSVQETLVDLGTGGSAEYPLGGAVVNTIPREGANRWNTTVFGAGTSNVFQADNLTSDLKDQGLLTTSSVRSIYDGSGLLGGPIVRDRLWFLTSHRFNGQTTRTANLFHDSNLDDLAYTPNISDPVDPQERNHTHQFRVSWQATGKDRIGASTDIQRHFRDQAFGELDRGTATIENSPAMCHIDSLTQVTWTRPQSRRLLLEGGTTISLNTFGRPTLGTDLFAAGPGQLPADYKKCGQSEPLRLSITSTNATTLPAYHGVGSVGIGIANQVQGRFTASVVTGAHSFKTGMTLLTGYTEANTMRTQQDIRDAAGIPLPISYQVNATTGLPTQLTEYAGEYSKTRLNEDLGLFVQDQWTYKRLTLQGGLRFDWLHASIPAYTEPATPLFGPFSSEALDDLPNWKDLSPRFGVSYDLAGDGKTALKFAVNRYVGTQTVGLAQQFGATANSITTRNWTDSNSNFYPDCDLKNPTVNGECGAFLNPSVGTFTANTTVPDPTLLTGWGKRDYNWQTSVSVERQLIRGLAVNAGYYHTAFRNNRVTDNLNRLPSDFDPYCITVPVDPRLPQSGQLLCGLWDARTSVGTSSMVTLAQNYADLYATPTGPIANPLGQVQSPWAETFNGVDVTMAARLPGGGSLRGGWSIGNSAQSGALVVAGGIVQSRVRQCYIVDNPQLLTSAVAPCDAEMPYQNRVRFNADYTLPWYGIQVAGVYQDLPGVNYSATLTYTSAQINAQPVGALGRNLLANTVTLDLLQPFTGFGPRVRQLDIRASKILKMQGKRLLASVDIYNLVNGHTPVFYRTGYTAPGANTSTPWLQPTQITDGRFFRFSVQFDL